LKFVIRNEGTIRENIFNSVCSGSREPGFPVSSLFWLDLSEDRLRVAKFVTHRYDISDDGGITAELAQ